MNQPFNLSNATFSVLHLFSNTVFLQGTQAEREPSPHQPQPTSHTDYQLVNADPLGAIQSPQSASLSPPPCKVESLLSPRCHSQVCCPFLNIISFYLHSNQHPTYQAPCQISPSLIRLSLLQLDSHLLPPCPPSTLSHFPFRPAPLCPSPLPLQHLCLLPTCLQPLQLLPLSLMPLSPILLTQGLHLLPLSPALLCLFAPRRDPLIPLYPLALLLSSPLLWFRQTSPPILRSVSLLMSWICQTCMHLSSLSSRPCGRGEALSVSTVIVCLCVGMFCIHQVYIIHINSFDQ